MFYMVSIAIGQSFLCIDPGVIMGILFTYLKVYTDPELKVGHEESQINQSK